MFNGISLRQLVVGYLRQLFTPLHYDQALALVLMSIVPFSLFERSWALAGILTTVSLIWLWLTMWRPAPGLDKFWITTASGRLQLRAPRLDERGDLRRIASQPGNTDAHGWGDLTSLRRPTIRQRFRRRRTGRYVWMTSTLVILDPRFNVIGSVSATPITATPETFEVGIVLDQECIGLGYATEALAAAIWAWQDEAGHRIFRAETSAENAAAIGTLSKVGFEKTGRSERTLSNGTVVDAATFEHRSPVPDRLIPTVSGATSFDLTPRGWI